MDIKIINDIGEIAEGWKSIQDNISFELSYDWYRNNLEVLSDDIFYICCFENNKLQVLLPIYHVKKDIIWSFNNPLKFLDGSNYLLNIPFDKSKLLFENQEYFLVTSPFGYQCDFININNCVSNNQKSIIIRAVDAKLKDEMKKRNVNNTFFLYVEENSLMDNFYKNSNFKIPIIYDCIANTNYVNFEDYLKQELYNPKDRREIKREERIFIEKGLKIDRINNFRDYIDILAKLEGNLLCKYGYSDSINFTYSKDWYYRLNKIYGDRSFIFIVKNNNGTIIGFSLFISDKNGKRIAAKATGFDYNLIPKNSYSYFNVVYYKPIRYAIENEVKQISFGCETYKAKIKRGCKLKQYNLICIFNKDSQFKKNYCFNETTQEYLNLMNKIKRGNI